MPIDDLQGCGLPGNRPRRRPLLDQLGLPSGDLLHRRRERRSMRHVVLTLRYRAVDVHAAGAIFVAQREGCIGC